MNKRQKEVQQQFLDNEKAVLKKLEGNYQDALDEINSKIELLMARQDADMQHVIYQVEYQKALKTQVQSILETLQTNEFETVSEYLANSYHDGFIGTMYDLQGQGIPLVFPIDQEMVVAAVQHETKLSENLYTALGKDITDLRKKIAGEISRGISGGQMYSEITRNIASWARIPKNNAMRIARTEMHRIQTKATMDACEKAKSKGSDIVKQWDSSLDKRTRDSHVKVDGEVRELDERFSNGLKYPGDPSGSASEVVNCRCALLQRARWALGNDYTKWSPDAPVVISDDGTAQLTIIEAKNYKEFQQKYIKASEQVRQGAQMMNDGRNRSGERKIRPTKNQSQKGMQNATTLEELNEIATERLGIEVNFTKGTVEYAREQLEFYEKLANEYNQTFRVAGIDTSHMFGSGAGAETFFDYKEKTATITLSGKKSKIDRTRIRFNTVMVDEENEHLSDLAHEFAHTISATQGGNEEFWEEIKAIKRSYKRALTKIDKENIVDKVISSEEAERRKKAIFISEYADESVDEFMAEAFADAKLGSKPSEYSKRVLEAIDKYFKKESLENSVKGSTMKMNLQFFAKKHKTKKVPNDNPLWDSLVQGNVKQQMEDGIFEWEHGGYDYLIEIKEKYDYEILSKKKKPNIHE